MEVEMLIYPPIIAFLAWRARHGSEIEKTLFVVNLALLWGSAIWLFGYPALIIPAVGAAFAILTTIVVLTSADFLPKRWKGEEDQ